MKHSIIVTATTAKGIQEVRITAFIEPVKPQPEYRENESVKGHFGTFFEGWNLDHPSFRQEDIAKYAPFQIGQEIYFRDPWMRLYFGKEVEHFYEATATKKERLLTQNYKWKPASTMPKSAARLFADIVDVKCVRVQDMDRQMLVDKFGFQGHLHSYWNELKEYVITKFGQQAWDNNIFVWFNKFKLKTAL